MALLKFKDWKEVNESSITDRLKNWISSTFGGSIEKIDRLLSEYKTSELRYIDEWEEVKTEVDKLSLQRGQITNDPAEVKRIDRMIDRNQSVLPAAQKAHKAKTDEIFLKVKRIIEENKRLADYWELNKSRVDSEVSEEMYRRAKQLSDDSLSSDLYSKYKKAVLQAKEKNDEFKKEYGEILPLRSPERIPYTYRSEIVPGNFGEAESRFELLSKFTILEFTEAIKGFTRDQAKKLISYLTNERNDRYVAMDMERDLLNTEIEKTPEDKEKREYASRRIKEIREKYMSEIRDLRSKITIAKKYA
jgi:hypothetical protein